MLRSAGANAHDPSTDSPPPAPARPPRRGRVRILAVLGLLVSAGVAGFRRYNHGRSNAAKSTSNPHQGQGGCHAPFTIPLWPHGKVPLARPDLEEAGHAPFLTAYIPQGKHASHTHMGETRLCLHFSFLAVYTHGKGAEIQYLHAYPFFLFTVSKSTGTSAVIAPGGGYHHVEIQGEGTPYAQWLCGQGVASYVLQYRCAGTG